MAWWMFVLIWLSGGAATLVIDRAYNGPYGYYDDVEGMVLRAILLGPIGTALVLVGIVGCWLFDRGN